MSRWIVMVALASCFSRPDPPPDCLFRGVSASYHHTCAIDADRRVWCWGDNGGHRVSSRDVPYELSPIAVVLPSEAAQITTGGAFSCARLTDGTVWCWGDTTTGQLGTLTPSATPVKIDLGSETAIDLGAGGSHVCIRRARDLKIACWGDNAQLQLGSPVPGPISTAPVEIDGTEGATQLVVGHRHTCALDANQKAVCWGSDRHGELGATTIGGTKPLGEVIELVATPLSLATAGAYSCAIAKTGTLQCWGRSDYGQLTVEYGDLSGQRLVDIPDVRQLALGSFGACAVHSNGTVTCWGDIYAGDGEMATGPTPRASTVTGVRVLVAGHFYMCAITDPGVVCWGQNFGGELGRGTRDIAATPASLSITADGVAVGRTHACAVSSHELRCWGENASGEVGDGTTTTAVVPMRIPVGFSVDGVTVGTRHTCAWSGSSGGNIKCWGENHHGQIGAPAGPVPGLMHSVTLTGVARQVVAGDVHTCALDTTGQVWCWGDNGSKQLGTDLGGDSATPLLVAGLGNIVQLTAGRRHTCAVRNDKAVLCWGSDTYGQIGNGGHDSATPVIQPLINNVVKVAAGDYHSCAMASDGTVSCWGRNNAGQLGINSEVDQMTPQLVGVSATDITAGGSGTCARSGSSNFCWGDGTNGEHGDGLLQQVNMPVKIDALENQTVVRGWDGACGIGDGAGLLSCWGHGRLVANGDQSTAQPQLVPLACHRTTHGL